MSRPQHDRGRTNRARHGWRGLVFLRGEQTFYLGSGAETNAHAAHEVKVCIAVHGSFRVRTGDGGGWESHRAAVIPSDRVHQLDARGAHVCLLYFSPETVDARRLLYAGGRVHTVPSDVTARFLPRLRLHLDNGCDGAEAAETCDELVRALSASASARVALDSRVVRAIEYLQSDPAAQTSAPEISATVALSPSRLAHLFSAQVGVPIRRYALNLRLRRALLGMAADASITDAAHESGFADAAHLTRTFRRMVGLPPSALTRGSTFLKV